jgi:hypothetical protein
MDRVFDADRIELGRNQEWPHLLPHGRFVVHR